MASPMMRLRTAMHTHGWPLWRSDRRTSLDIKPIEHTATKLCSTIENALVDVVYSSNYIEMAGSNRDYTDRLCRQVFRGENENLPVDIDEHHPEFKEAHKALLATLRFRNPTPQAVNRSRVEVVRHAEAFSYAIDHFIIDGKPITEDMIKQVQRILATGTLDPEEGTPGDYRQHEIAARHGMKKRSLFIRARSVPDYMAQLVRDLQEDLEAIEAHKTTVDPFDLATRYAHRFVNIHPFPDGNGRTCRILLNLLLLKHGGHVVSFGGHEIEREEYLDIAARSSKRFHEEDMEIPEREQTGHRELAIFTMRKSAGVLDRLWACVE